MTVETGKAMSEKGESSEIEFRSCDDDAWYNVQVMVEEGEEGDSFGRLRVKFCGLKDQVDYLFHSKDFSSLKELDDFSARFRALSLQLQDAECYKISKGLTVCASHHFKKDDLRFFDAVVEGVSHFFISLIFSSALTSMSVFRNLLFFLFKLILLENVEG